MTTLPLVMFWFADATVLAFRHRIVAKADSTELQHVFSCAQRVSAFLTPTTPPAGTARAARSPQTTACRSVSRSGALPARAAMALADSSRSSANTGRSASARSSAACIRIAVLGRRPPSFLPCAFSSASASRVRWPISRCSLWMRSAGDRRDPVLRAPISEPMLHWSPRQGRGCSLAQASRPVYRGGLSSNVTIAVAVSQGMSIVQTGSWRQTVWSGTR